VDKPLHLPKERLQMKTETEIAIYDLARLALLKTDVFSYCYHLKYRQNSKTVRI